MEAVEWGVQNRIAGLTRRGTGDRDQSQSGQNCNGEENSARQGKTGTTQKWDLCRNKRLKTQTD
jgi:hypothetical protein